MSVGGTTLVTGATGQQGGAVARELLAAGHSVRAMTRNPESERAQALAGVAREHGVQHFVYTSVGSAHRETRIPHFDNKWRVEEAIRSYGFPSHTVLRPAFFMENWLSPWFKPAIDEGNLAIGIKPDTKLQMIAVADIGRYGKLAFEQSEKLSGQAIDIAGDALTMPQAAEIVGRASGKTVSFVQVPIEQVREFSADFAAMLEWFDNVGYEADIEGNAKRYGIEPTSFEAWAKGVAW
ncbi:MAG: NmrA/HSCARG family protein [Gemmatimonadota bacterium]|nr:MAG: NmrA/HSCARG family protein [Gemmatimonadota bacterium]